MIQLKAVLHQMETHRDLRGRPVPFHLQFVTCDETKGTGGEPLDLEGVVLAKTVAPASRPTGRNAPGTAGKRSNEWANGTRNFYILESLQVRKVHIRLITQFNHETVVY